MQRITKSANRLANPRAKTGVKVGNKTAKVRGASTPITSRGIVRPNNKKHY